MAVIAVNWNGRRDCEAMLGSIRSQTLAPAEIWWWTTGPWTVLGSGSRPSPRCRCSTNTANRGFAVAVNQGLRATSAPCVLLCNLDVSWTRRSWRNLVARAETAGDIGSVGGRLRGGSPGAGPRLDSTGHVLYRNGWVANRDQGAPDDGRRRQPEEVFGVSAAAALYRREMLEDVSLNGAGSVRGLFRLSGGRGSGLAGPVARLAGLV